MSDDTLTGRHAVVTGGGRGIGLAVAKRLAELGADLTLMGRNESSLADAKSAITATHGVKVFTTGADVTDADSVAAAFRRAFDALGGVAILVNNAGAAESAPFKHTDLELWNRMIEVNLTGVYLCTHQVLPAMVEAGWGRIINIASTAGLAGSAYVTAYCAAKHGVIGLTRSLAVETARTGVTVNAVCPGYTETDMVSQALTTITEKTGCSEDEALAQLVAQNPQGRLIDPEEVAHTVASLTMEKARSITGQALAVAGGAVM